MLGPGGAVCGCYRVTRDGLREFRRLNGLEPVEELSGAPENARVRPPRKKKDRAGTLPVMPHPDQPHDAVTEGRCAHEDHGAEGHHPGGNHPVGDADVGWAAPDADGGDQRE